MASASPIVTRGFGPNASIALVVTAGYAVAAVGAVGVQPVTLKLQDVLIWQGPRKKRKRQFQFTARGGVRWSRSLVATVEYHRAEMEDEEALLAALMGVDNEQ